VQKGRKRTRPHHGGGEVLWGKIPSLKVKERTLWSYKGEARNNKKTKLAREKRKKEEKEYRIPTTFT